MTTKTTKATMNFPFKHKGTTYDLTYLGYSEITWVLTDLYCPVCGNKGLWEEDNPCPEKALICVHCENSMSMGLNDRRAIDDNLTNEEIIELIDKYPYIMDNIMERATLNFLKNQTQL